MFANTTQVGPQSFNYTQPECIFCKSVFLANQTVNTFQAAVKDGFCSNPTHCKIDPDPQHSTS